MKRTRTSGSTCVQRSFLAVLAARWGPWVSAGGEDFVACGRAVSSPKSHSAGDTAVFAGIEMVWIPAGTFMMGRVPDEQDSLDREDYRHQVTLTRGYWMSKYETTKLQWETVMGTTPWTAPGTYSVSANPYSLACYVSWYNAQDFVAAMNALDGPGGFRLPTEAEWEWACRAGTTTRFYWRDDPGYTEVGQYAWYHQNPYDVDPPEDFGHPVGIKYSNAWGLYDMAGNVYEWCQDCYGSYASSDPVTDPTGPDQDPAPGSVMRGGGFANWGAELRSGYRCYGWPVQEQPNVGFRVVRFDTTGSDVDGNGAVNAVDIQLVVNAVLGISIGLHSADANADGNVDARDVQSVVNAYLGVG